MVWILLNPWILGQGWGMFSFGGAYIMIFCGWYILYVLWNTKRFCVVILENFLFNPNMPNSACLVINPCAAELWYRRRLLNSLRPNDAYMRHYNKPTLVQIMACRLFGAKPLSEPVLLCWQLMNLISWNFIQNSKDFIKEMHLKMSSVKWRPFCLGLNVLNKCLSQTPCCHSPRSH